jgi:hypothetical protein
MTAARPEADTEYSRAHRASQGPPGPSRPSGESPGRATAVPVLIAGVAGALLLLVAEFTPLLHVRSGAGARVIDTISTGSHQSYALVPLALAALLFSVTIWRTRNRLALLATGLLGVVALLIALLGDLPDAQANGLIGTAATHYAVAAASPATGLYLETAGAVLLIISAVGGLLLLPAPTRPRRPPATRRPEDRPSGARSAS